MAVREARFEAKSSHPQPQSGPFYGRNNEREPITRLSFSGVGFDHKACHRRFYRRASNVHSPPPDINNTGARGADKNGSGCPWGHCSRRLNRCIGLLFYFPGIQSAALINAGAVGLRRRRRCLPTPPTSFSNLPRD